MRAKIEKDVLRMSLSVRHPEFLDNMRKLMDVPVIREEIEKEDRGYGVNNSTLIQWCVNHCAKLHGDKLRK